jgi:hypothetical protein
MKKRFALCAFLSLGVGCSTTGPTGPTTGSLQITVTGLPSGPAAISVTGPAGFSQMVTATTTLTNLTPGLYTLAASPVVVSGSTYTSTPASSTVNVVASSTATPATVTYAIADGGLQITVTGLPSGPAAITVTGPGGFSHVVTVTTTLSNLTPGMYTLTVSPVVVSNSTYSSTPASFNVTVTASSSPATATVAYVLASGSLAITVTGLPSGSAAISVTGPGGFNQTVTATTTLFNLTPGTYVLRASPVVVSNSTYASTPASSNVTVTASLTPVPATVTYAIASGSLAITVAGLPSGPAAISVTGPGGFNRMVVATTTLSNLPPGAYMLTASPVVVSNSTYASTPASTNVTVVASTTATPATVTYAIASGSLMITVTGLPSGGLAAITVTGPGEFNQIVTATTTLLDLTPGTYMLTASTVAVLDSTYGSTPTSSTISVTASLTPATAAFAYLAQGTVVNIGVYIPGSGGPVITVTGTDAPRRMSPK